MSTTEKTPNSITDWRDISASILTQAQDAAGILADTFEGASQADVIAGQQRVISYLSNYAARIQHMVLLYRENTDYNPTDDIVANSYALAEEIRKKAARNRDNTPLDVCKNVELYDLLAGDVKTQAEAQRLAESGTHRYNIVCRDHGSATLTHSLKKARALMKAPATFCAACRGPLADPAPLDIGSRVTYTVDNHGRTWTVAGKITYGSPDTDTVVVESDAGVKSFKKLSDLTAILPVPDPPPCPDCDGTGCNKPGPDGSIEYLSCTRCDGTGTAFNTTTEE